jgi:hypothetical protein
MRDASGTSPQRTEEAVKAQLTGAQGIDESDVGTEAPTPNAYIAMIIQHGRHGAFGVRPNCRGEGFVARGTQRRVAGHSNRFTRPLIARSRAHAMRDMRTPATFASTPNGRQAATPIATGDSR